MKYAICNLSIVPVRAEASDKSEMVSQILFGELLEIVQEKEPWLQIRTEADGYEGWIDHKQIHRISDAQFEKIRQQDHSLALELVYAATSSNNHIPICLGSNLPFYDGMTFNDRNRTMNLINAQIPHFSRYGFLK